MITSTDARASRNTALDGLRGIAILAVILCHSSIVGPHQSDSTIAKALLPLLDFGWAGVDLFFVLSGFLITQIILSTREKAGWMKSFYIKRVFRILPIYFLFLIVVLVVGYAFIAERYDYVFIKEYQAYFWLMLQNFLPLVYMNWTPSFLYTEHLWTLAVEWQFYMIWPFIAGRLSHKALAGLCVLVIAVALVSRLVLWQLDTHISVIYTLTLTRMDSIAMGALLALAVRSGLDRTMLKKLANVLVGGGVVFIALMFYLYGGASYSVPLMYTVGYTLLAFFFGGLVLKAVIIDEDARYRGMLSNRFLTTIGKYSYAMYIVHWPIMNTLGAYIRGYISSEFYAQLFYLPAVFLATLAIAMVTWRAIEAPALAYARHRAIVTRPAIGKPQAKA